MSWAPQSIYALCVEHLRKEGAMLKGRSPVVVGKALVAAEAEPPEEGVSKTALAIRQGIRRRKAMAPRRVDIEEIRKAIHERKNQVVVARPVDPSADMHKPPRPLGNPLMSKNANALLQKLKLRTKDGRLPRKYLKRVRELLKERQRKEKLLRQQMLANTPDGLGDDFTRSDGSDSPDRKRRREEHDGAKRNRKRLTQFSESALSVSIADQKEAAANPTGEVSVEGESYYLIERIEGERKKGRRIEYLIKWLNYPESVNSWEPRSNVTDAALKHYYKRKQELARIAALSPAAAAIVGGEPHEHTTTSTN